MFHRKYEVMAHIMMFLCLCDQLPNINRIHGAINLNKYLRIIEKIIGLLTTCIQTEFMDLPSCCIDQVGKTSESEFYSDSNRVQINICGTFIFYLGGFLSVEGVRLQAFCSLLTFLPYAVM